MDWKVLEQSLITGGLAIGTKLLGAIAVYIGGRYLIGMVMRVLARILRSYKLDETVMAYLSSIINVLLNIVLVMGCSATSASRPRRLRRCWRARASPSARPGAGCWRTLPPASSCSFCVRSKWATLCARAA